MRKILLEETSSTNDLAKAIIELRKNGRLLKAKDLEALAKYGISSAEREAIGEVAKEQRFYLMARSQTMGRGQFTRKWESHKDKSLCMSVALWQPALAVKIETISLFLGQLLQTYFAKKGIKTWVKAPNDLYLGERKLAGILCESTWNEDTLKSLVIGIGINVKEKWEDFSEERKKTATSLWLASHENWDIKNLAEEISILIEEQLLQG